MDFTPTLEKGGLLPSVPDGTNSLQTIWWFRPQIDSEDPEKSSSSSVWSAGTAGNLNCGEPSSSPCSRLDNRGLTAMR
jgi:hypothetical protein